MTRTKLLIHFDRERTMALHVGFVKFDRWCRGFQAVPMGELVGECFAQRLIFLWQSKLVEEAHRHDNTYLIPRA